MNIASSTTRLSEIPVDQLKRGKYQPRQHFDEQQLQELAKTIKTTGELLQPIIVRPINNGYEIIAGERRWRAAQLAGFEVVTCLIRNYSDEQALETAIIENVSRSDLNPIEEAQAYQRLMEEFGYLHEEIAAMVGKSRAKITNSLRMLKLDPHIQSWIKDGYLSEGHGKIIAGLSRLQQSEFAQNTMKHHWSVRKLEMEIKKATESINLKSQKDPNIRSLERKLSEEVGCRVTIELENNKGKLSIDFHNLDILEGVIQKMGIDNRSD